MKPRRLGCRGGFSYCARELGWDPKTIRKGRQELVSGVDFGNRPTKPGRKRTEARLPTLLADLRQLLDEQSQIAPKGYPSFQSVRLYTRLSVSEVLSQLLERHGYTDKQLPTNEALRQRINGLGYKLRTVKNNQPKKRSPRRAQWAPASSPS